MTDKTEIKQLLIAKFNLTEDRFKPATEGKGFIISDVTKKEMKPMRQLLINRLINFHADLTATEILVY